MAGLAKSLSWQVVEKKINEEINWLDENIQAHGEGFDQTDSNDPLSCRHCLLRYIAILIISGSITARELKGLNLWQSADTRDDMESKDELKKQHGGEWHFKHMKLLNAYFTSYGYTVKQEPKLNYGTADLLAIKKNEKPLFIEVGSVSLYKLLYNLCTMEGSDILLVPRDNYVLEFQINKRAYPF